MSLPKLLARSARLHSALVEAVGPLELAYDEPRVAVTADALAVAAQHSDALLLLMEQQLHVTAMGALRMQYEAVVRAVWTLFAASDDAVTRLAAPLTRDALKAAKSLGLNSELLTDIDESPAPADLKRELREFRTSYWDVLNSYIHSGLVSLRRHDGHFEHELLTAVRMSNGLATLVYALMTIVCGRVRAQADINVVCAAFMDCLPQRHPPPPPVG